MKFYDGKEPYDVLGNYEIHPTSIHQDNNNGIQYFKEIYLDGHTIGGFNDKSYAKELDSKLLDLAKKRDEETFSDVRFQFDKDLMIFLLTAPVAIASAMASVGVLFIIAGSISLYFASKLPKDKWKLNELKKYRLYISMMDELAKTENINILDAIEFERIWQIPLSINTIDRYSYRDMKVLKKELKRKNNKKEKSDAGFQFESGNIR